LNHDYILLSNNEQGLRARDVSAICSLAVSTKTSEQNHIGEKGVGSKSVFAASNQPILISHSWKFRFQVSGSDTMSYITPLWVHDEDIPQCILNQISTNRQHTHLYLPLKLTSNARLKTRSALSRRNDVSKLPSNYLFIQFQKSTIEHSRCVFLLSSSRRFSSVFCAREGRIGRTFMSKGRIMTISSALFTLLSGTYTDATCNVPSGT
jgi:hypothetical protein